MKHHLLIAGTGRAGTSFLVQYLTACGLDTHARHHPNEKLDENANAGLEDLPMLEMEHPYVLKSPWLYEYIERLLARDDIRIDAVVIPMRDIVEAATSRVTLSLRERFGDTKLHEEHTLWETWGTTPGGVVYSLNPLDQARLLAMGFHQVIHALVRKKVPIVFLDFPRFAEDGDYLFEQLRPVIESKVTREAAIEAHRKTARPDMVRTGSELSVTSPAITDTVARFPAGETVERAALFRELRRAQMSEQLAIRKANEASHEAAEARRMASESSQQASNAIRQASDAIGAADHTSQMLNDRDRQLADLPSKVAALAQRHADAIAALDLSRSQLSQAEAQIAALQAEQVQWQLRTLELESRLRTCSETLGEVLSSTSWRLTSPVRSMLAGLRRGRLRSSR